MLYQILGVPIAAIQGKRVLEFGPGSGHNSVCVARHDPEKYVLVDGVQTIIEAARKRFEECGVPREKYLFVNALFEEFSSECLFDLVIAEACIPLQHKPTEMLEHIAGFVKPGGLLIITTISATSYLPEILRRVGKVIISKEVNDSDQLVNRLSDIYKSHGESLPGMQRSIKDWVLDNLIQPLSDQKLLSIPDAIRTLQLDFDFFGSSPNFSEDWRWFKSIDPTNPEISKSATEAYFRKTVNLVDFRIYNQVHEAAVGQKLEAECSKVWAEMLNLEGDKEASWDPFWRSLTDITEILEGIAPTTAVALAEAKNWLKEGCPDSSLPEFSRWWGRGQQYVSFLRR